jgi:hypothetical protein
VRRKYNAYVAHSIVKSTCKNIPLHFKERFIEEIEKTGRRENAKPWDKEGPRVMCKDFNDKKVLFLTTRGAVSHLCSLEDLDALINEE